MPEGPVAGDLRVRLAAARRRSWAARLLPHSQVVDAAWFIDGAAGCIVLRQDGFELVRDDPLPERVTFPWSSVRQVSARDEVRGEWRGRADLRYWLPDPDVAPLIGNPDDAPAQAIVFRTPQLLPPLFAREHGRLPARTPVHGLFLRVNAPKAFLQHPSVSPLVAPFLGPAAGWMLGYPDEVLRSDRSHQPGHGA